MSTADDEKVLASTVIMATGTIVSRSSGFVRSALLAAALGVQVHAELFNIANTVPNMLYILLAGGIFNAVLVPQLVRAMRNDADGGEAYTNRVVTLAGLFLAGATVLLVAAAPLVMAVLLNGEYSGPDLAEQRQSAINLARYCLPQVFFYGMFVLVGQILNSRGRFGPMMWAPIANNLISIATLVGYLVVFGPASPAEQLAGYSSGQELLLGVGSTLGIVAQFAILVPYLRAAGFTYRPRFDFRHTGLGHTLWLGLWTVLFIVVNQIAYVVVVRLGSGGPAESSQGTGTVIYAGAFLIVMVPHSIITVSLATAVMPRLSALAAEGDLSALSRSLASSVRSAFAVVLPFAALLPVIAPDLAKLIWGYLAASETYDRYVPTLSLFGLGLVFFTLHYLMLRGFYSLEDTRTVFFIQCAVAGTNIAVAVALVALTDAAFTAPALVLAYTAAYVVGSGLSYLVLRSRLGGLETPRLVRYAVRLLLAVAGSTGLALALALMLRRLTGEPTFPVAIARTAVVTAADLAAFWLLARALGVREVAELISTFLRPVLQRVPGRRGRSEEGPSATRGESDH